MYLARKIGNYSFPKIAAAFNRNDHTTVMHAVSKIEDLREKNQELNQVILELEDRLNAIISKT
jgi:chromosomal replication initiator protein